MALKDVMYYTLLGRWAGGTGFCVFAVTSESGFNNRRANGRMIRSGGDFEATHARKDDCIGRFETEQAARDKIAEVILIREHHKEPIKAARDALREAEQDERNAIAECLSMSADRV